VVDPEQHPAGYQPRHREETPCRVADDIASLTGRFVIAPYESLFIPR
jgi:hypothetical protein